jgi:ribosomal-protein-alanine N-acetyltransferase
VHSQTVTIRPPEPRDEREFVDAMLASRELHEPWAQPPTTAEAFAIYLDRCRAPECEGFLICAGAGESAPIAGFANLSQIFFGNLCSAYLGFSAVRDFAGRGLMSAGLRLVLAEGFGRVGLHRIEANIQPGNERSRRLVERLGFRHEGFSPRYLRIGGEWRDHDHFALLADEFER